MKQNTAKSFMTFDKSVEFPKLDFISSIEIIILMSCCEGIIEKDTGTRI